MAVQVGWAGLGFAPLHSEHIVQLYKADHELVDNVCAYALEAFRYQHSVLFLATKQHCDAFRQRLRMRGHNVDALIRSGHLTFVTAEEAMPRFMRGDQPDETLFKSLVRRLLEHARGDGRFQHVQVFGELVDVLWQGGNGAATLRVEELWNELRQTVPGFTLYCGFHVDKSPDELLASSMRDILTTHSHLLDAASTPKEMPAPRGVLVQLADLTRDDATVIGGKLRELSSRQPHGGPGRGS